MTKIKSALLISTLTTSLIGTSVAVQGNPIFPPITNKPHYQKHSELWEWCVVAAYIYCRYAGGNHHLCSGQSKQLCNWLLPEPPLNV